MRTMLRLSCALAAHLIASDDAHAAVINTREVYELIMQQQQQKQHMLQAKGGHEDDVIGHPHRDRLPTQPIHRSILSHRKRTVLQERHAAVRNDDGAVTDYSSLSLRAPSKKDGRMVEEEGSSNNNYEEDSEEQQEQSNSSDEEYSSPSNDEPDEPISQLLTSPWWVQIHEEFGQNSFNFIPGSRRAASSVVFTYNYGNNDRVLSDQEEEEEMEKMEKVKEDINALVESFGGGGERNKTDTTNNDNDNVHLEPADASARSNTTVATYGAVHESESNESNTASEPAENGNSAEYTDGADSDYNDDASSEQGADPGQIDDNTLYDNDEDGQSSDYSTDQETSNSRVSPGGEEYMIISGGYTDHDWKTFPVYAFPLTSSIRTLSGEWIDLSPPEMDVSVKAQCNEDDGEAAREKLYAEAKYLDDADDSSEDPWENAAPCAPSGRMGHQSVIHNGKLYVFGGLIYDKEQAPGGYGRKEAFRLEDVPFVYRLDLVEMFEARKTESGDGGDRSMQQQAVTGWQRIIPRVKPFSTHQGMSTSAAEVLLTSVNRGEMQGGLWSTGENDKFVMYGGLRIARLEYEGYHGHNNGHPSKFVKGENTFGSSHQQMHSHKIVELPLGDVWAYDLVLDAWERITNNYGRGINTSPKNAADVNSSDNGRSVQNNGDDVLSGEDDDDWLEDLNADYSLYPRPRTAHAATVVGNELIIHGGMGWNERTNDWDGSTDWESLDDMWILDLTTREWKRRWVFPQLVRSYHSLVGWDVDESIMPLGEEEREDDISWEGPVVVAFGGYTTGIDVFSGEEVAYVFDDLLVSYPPPSTNYDEPPSPWLKASTDTNRISGSPFISTRYEHSAVISKEGVLTVWGGSFSGTSDVKGMWMINVAGNDSTVTLSIAEDDSIYDDYERTITALHTIVIMLMFMSISLTLLLGLTQRYQELVQQANDDAAMAAGMAFSTQDGGESPVVHRGNGLHPEIIDTIPQKVYSPGENNNDHEGEQECCPICLLEYSEGDVLRVLPCDHYMHKSCLDAWLANNPSCPSCRYSLRELVDDRPMMQLRTLRSRLSNNVALARFLGHDYADSIGGIEMTSPNEAVIDLRYVSSLDLSEEDTESDARGEGSQQQRGAAEAPDPLTLTAMDELSSWRSRRRQLQRDRRRPRLVSLRHNISRTRPPRRSRIPLADLDDE